MGGHTMLRLLTGLALWCLVINFTRGKAACIGVERDALAAFNASITDAGGRLRSWQGENCCNWGGVSCSKKTGHVVKLDLGGYSLKGEISPSLAALTRLVHLNLSHGDFGAVPIPEFIGSFKMLRYLDLSHAGFGGIAPPQLGNLSRLVYLDLGSFGGPGITVNNFRWVSKLTSLRYLDLSWLYLAASVDWLQAVNMLPSLQVLRLNDASLPATDLTSLSQVNFTSLTLLNLKNNDLNSSMPNWIDKLSALSELDMTSCGLSGMIPDDLGKLTSLMFIGLGDNKLTGAIPTSASRLCNLVQISLSGNILSGDIAEAAKSLFPCMKQLQILELAGNNLTRNLSGWLEVMSGLRILDLSANSLSGVVPHGIGNLSSLTYLDISFNRFKGTLSELHFANLLRLDTLDLASNSFEIVVKQSWMPPFQLINLGLHDCLVGPEFPTWLQSQTIIEMTDLGSAGIRGPLPDWIWNFSLSMTSLNVSTNNITGMLPASLEPQLTMLTTLSMRNNKLQGNIPDLPLSIRVLDLSCNNLSGPLPHSFRDKELHYLSLSKNYISGVIPTDFCNMISLELIDLSDNNLSGQLPNCWQKKSELYAVDFSSNNLWGEIPSTMGSLNSLMSLHLSKNRLSGVLPTSLQSCQMLMFLDLAENNLSGNIPKWIGDSLKSLILVRLGSNQFSGGIPEELSQLPALHYLDLSNNKLSGPVPHFWGNLTALHLVNQDQDRRTSPFLQYKVYGLGGAYFFVYTDTLEVMTKGHNFLYEEEMYVMKGIDLSANLLSGEIPNEIGFLSSLINLNLSRNHIGGSIPAELGNLVDLESLDLSWNDLSGPIPDSFASLTSLGFLNLSYNDLSGKIPSRNQLATFDNYSFWGNENLCGPPLDRICVPESNKHWHHKHHLRFDTLTCLFTLLGFAFGISTVFTTFICSVVTRKAYFRFTNRVLGKLRTAVEMKLSINRMMPAGGDPSMATRSQDSITCYELEQSSTAIM
ncbi:receptor-like protein EIX1 isoform X2 [Triticum dicoccoides]|uniref:receptor-like protein EIX1 isoform X2 n=1 Tax=Triticum dicoccoides TaxID=85692 RepID=UPI00188FAA55|nr:receptor-like protein EIX1 isoform X2 [Triticum dicoccoides]